MSVYGPGYDSMNDAAGAASYQLQQQPQWQNQEYTTAIVEKDGKFYRKQFATSGQGGSAPIGQVFNTLEPDERVVAVLHNHPGTHPKFDPKYLSDADTALGKGQQHGQKTGPITMYLLANGQDRVGTGDMVKTVGVDRTPYFLQNTDRFLSAWPWEEQKQHMMRTMGRDPNDPRGLMMGDTVRPANPAVTGTQRKAMVDAITQQANSGTPGAPPSPQTPPPKPRAMDMGGAPNPLPPGMNTFGSPMGAPPPTLSPQEQALIQALRAHQQSVGAPQ